MNDFIQSSIDSIIVNRAFLVYVYVLPDQSLISFDLTNGKFAELSTGSYEEALAILDSIYRAL